MPFVVRVYSYQQRAKNFKYGTLNAALEGLKVVVKEGMRFSNTAKMRWYRVIKVKGE